MSKDKQPKKKYGAQREKRNPYGKGRMLYSKFWSDSWIRRLNPLDRYLFIYLVTNERCSYCGIYELPLDVMSFETGIDERDLVNAFLPRLEPKIFYDDGWVYIVNYIKFHVSSRSKNSIIGLEHSLLALPNARMAKFLDIIESFGGAMEGLHSSLGSSTFTFTLKSTNVDYFAINKLIASSKRFFAAQETLRNNTNDERTNDSKASVAEVSGSSGVRGDSGASGSSSSTPTARSDSSIGSSSSAKIAEPASVARRSVARKPARDPADPIVLDEEIAKMEDSPRRDINIIAHYFEVKRPKLENYGQLSVAIRRHLRAAGQLKSFSDRQIVDGCNRAARMTDEWTLDTVVKMLTK